jgi:hypothetical protein
MTAPEPAAAWRFLILDVYTTQSLPAPGIFTAPAVPANRIRRKAIALQSNYS